MELLPKIGEPVGGTDWDQLTIYRAEVTEASAEVSELQDFIPGLEEQEISELQDPLPELEEAA